MSREPTPQQKSCMKAITSGTRMLKITACAGGGKTSTLGMMADSKAVNSLYLAFNKVTATEAAEKFPPHVTAQTTHSRAYRAFGAELAQKLSRPRGAYVNVAGTGSEIARYYHIESYETAEGVVISSAFIGLLVRETLSNYEQSADEQISSNHVPRAELKAKLKDDSNNIARVVDTVFKVAKKLWAERINPDSPVLATHDTYLKMFQLSKPIFTGFDVLYVDEFQDTTPCVLDIIMNQSNHMQVVMVGDARQAIYGWRGAVNAMQLVKCEERKLTKSFRYGQAVANVASTVLENDMKIVGNENIDSIVGGFNIVNREEPHTRLFRTNAMLLMDALPVIEKGTPCALEIDVKDFVKLMQSAIALKEGRLKEVKHDALIAFQTWEELQKESGHSPELGRIAKMVDQDDGYTAQRAITVLESFKNSSAPLVTFTTAHKSKGREWDQVIVENDFKSCYEDGKWKGLSFEEQNLLYVAVTRAIKRLEYNFTVEEYLNKAQSESFIPHSRSSEYGTKLFGAVRGGGVDTIHSPPWETPQGDMAQFYLEQEQATEMVESVIETP